LFPDSTWKSHEETGKTFSGVWVFRNGRLVFAYDGFPQTYHEPALVLDAADDTFLVQELNGTKTLFSRLISRSDSPHEN
jgi:hypothetical protein